MEFLLVESYLVKKSGLLCGEAQGLGKNQSNPLDMGSMNVLVRHIKLWFRHNINHISYQCLVCVLAIPHFQYNF